MISRIFKNNDKLLLISLPLVALIAVLFSLAGVSTATEIFPNSVLLPFILGGIRQIWLFKLLNFFFMLSGSFLVYRLCVHHEVGDKQNFIPAFVYLLLVSTLNSESPLHPLVIAHIPLLLMLLFFLSTYRKDGALSLVFDGAFLLALASLFYLPLLFFFPVAFIALIIFRTFSLREWILILIGLILPYFLAFSLLWIANTGADFWVSKWEQAFVSLHAPVFKRGSFLINTMVIILLLLATIHSFMHGFGNKVKTKKGKYLLWWMLFIGLLLTFVISESPVFTGTLIIIPASVFIGDYTGKIKKTGIADFLLLLFITAFVFSRLQSIDFFNA